MVEIKKKPNLLIKNKKDNFLFTIPVPLKKGIFSVDIPYLLCPPQLPTWPYTCQFLFQCNFEKLWSVLNRELLKNQNPALPHLNQKNPFKCNLSNFDNLTYTKTISSHCLFMGIRRKNGFLPSFYGWKNNPNLNIDHIIHMV